MINCWSLFATDSGEGAAEGAATSKERQLGRILLNAEGGLCTSFFHASLRCASALVGYHVAGGWVEWWSRGGGCGGGGRSGGRGVVSCRVGSRPRGYVQNAPCVCKNARVSHYTRAFCSHTRRRFARAHGHIALCGCRHTDTSWSLSSRRLLVIVITTTVSWGSTWSSCCCANSTAHHRSPTACKRSWKISGRKNVCFGGRFWEPRETSLKPLLACWKFRKLLSGVLLSVLLLSVVCNAVCCFVLFCSLLFVLCWFLCANSTWRSFFGCSCDLPIITFEHYSFSEVRFSPKFQNTYVSFFFCLAKFATASSKGMMT